MSDRANVNPVLDGTIDPVLFERLSAAAAGAVRAGTFAPTFRLQSRKAGAIALVDLLAQGPLAISFYRGVWCSFCDTALEELGVRNDEIVALGARQVAIGPPPTSVEQESRLDRLPMPVLVDHRLQVASSYGLTAPLPGAAQSQYESLGYAPAARTADGEALVPIPATYILDRDGRIVLTSIDLDYRNRLSPTQVIAALRALKPSATHAPPAAIRI